jgi:hypothetical protein
MESPEPGLLVSAVPLPAVSALLEKEKQRSRLILEM